MPAKKRQGNPEFGYYPMPTESAPLPVQGYPEPTAGEMLVESAEPPRDLGTGMRLTTASRNFVATLVADENDLPPHHLALLLRDSCCITCGEEYPGTGTEHWIAWNAESGRWELRDAAHRANWISAPKAQP